jgi:hypothetical protein
MNPHTGDLRGPDNPALQVGHPLIVGTPAADPTGPYQAARRRGWRWALIAGGALVGVYAVTLSLLNGPAYALDTSVALWYWITPLVAGFALQVGLFGYSRTLAMAGASPHASGVVASGGASAVSMIACCAHHLVNVLPLIGLAGAALFLASYQSLFLLAGVLSNAVGTVYLLGEMQKHGLYAPHGAVLAPLLRRPVRAAVPYLAGIAVLILVIATYLEVWA